MLLTFRASSHLALNIALLINILAKHMMHGTLNTMHRDYLDLFAFDARISVVSVDYCISASHFVDCKAVQIINYAFD